MRHILNVVIINYRKTHGKTDVLTVKTVLKNI